MLSPTQNSLLDNIIVITKNIVILQTLKAGYLTELESNYRQETKNLRSGALLDLARSILENLEPLMEYLVDIQQGKISIYREQLQVIDKLVVDLGDFYGWAAEEISIKNTRIELLNSKL